MSDTRRPRGYGSVKRRKGTNWVCVWRRLGQGETMRSVPSRHEGELLLARVWELEQSGEPLSCAIRKALGRPEPVAVPDPPTAAVTLSRLADLYIADEGLGAVAASRFLRLKSAPFADMEFGTYRVVVVKEWVKKREGAGTAKGTIRNDLNSASKLVGWGQNEQIIEADAVNVFARARKTVEAVERRQRTALDADELATLYRAIQQEAPEFVGMFLGLASTGWRINEIAHLTWADVDIDGGFVTFTPTKPTRKNPGPKRAALTPQLLEYIGPGPGIGRLFVRPAYLAQPAGAWATESAGTRLRKAMASCVERNEIPAVKLDGDDKTMRFDSHAMRHTVRSILTNAGHGDLLVDTLVGHKNGVRGGYTHAQAEGLRTLADTLGQVLDRNPDARSAQA